MNAARVDKEWWAILLALALAGVGWGVHSTLLALAGMLGAITTFLLWIWQRECLTGVTYRRTLSQHRAVFGEQVNLDVEFVNDKLLPLTWLHVSDDVPAELTIHSGATVPVHDGAFAQFHHLLPMLPYARVRRRLTIVCDRRGEHTFGPARLRSGNPVGYRTAYGNMRERSKLLVYPKLFQLVSANPASRVPLGDDRSRLELLGDPSRPVGVRDYRAGDPIRHVDWRASARSSGLLVRVFEPTSALRVAVFADIHPPGGAGLSGVSDISEFIVALTASVINELAGRGVATGLFTNATVDGRAIASAPSNAGAALPSMLELLARCSAWSRAKIGDVLATEGPRLGRGASVVLIASTFPATTLAAVAELRRRLPVTLIRIVTADAPADKDESTGLIDATWEVTYRDGWKQLDTLELAQ